MLDEGLIVATHDKAAALAGISERGLEHWTRSGVVRPTVDNRVTPGRVCRWTPYGATSTPGAPWTTFSAPSRPSATETSNGSAP
jgi:hypothetical protein